ncbi:MAG: ATP-binding protein [Deltaproteobacteria bacterium]|jgi:two-component system, OmpR family, sensor histidine kinase BaeS
MRLNLSIKFFIAFLVTSFTIVVVMIVAMQFYAYQSFSDYIHKVEAIRLSELTPVMIREYQDSKGWDRLRDNSERWKELLRPRGSAAYSEKAPLMPSGFESHVKPSQLPPPRERRGEDRPDRRRGFPETDALRDGQGERPPPDDRDAGRRPPRDDRDRDDRPIFGIEHRLALFDAQKGHVVGRAEFTADHTLQEIAVNGETVGWLGLRNEDSLSDPLDIAFLKQQSRIFYIVGAIALVLAAVVAFLLSRHLLAPVQQLINGARSLTSRKFDTRINVNSSDELGQLAVDFNLMAQTLEQYEQLRQQWISDIAHELRTPLSILRGEIEALQDGIREASSHRLESLHDEVVHISKIVNNLHDLSLAESAALRIKREPVNLALAVRTCLNKFQGMFNRRGIVIVDELGDTETITIHGDKDRLMQVFSNLLENTLRYTDSPGCLTVRNICATSSVLLLFADTKPTVPTEALNRLFDRLYRVDQSRSRAHGGSGLGLSICKTIIEAHDGTITAQHAATGGLQIEIMLPLHNIATKNARKVTNNHDK